MRKKRLSRADVVSRAILEDTDGMIARYNADMGRKLTCGEWLFIVVCLQMGGEIAIKTGEIWFKNKNSSQFEKVPDRL